jgi:MFS family permease
MGDLLGRRRLLLAGIVVFAAASVAGGLAPSLRILIAARAVQGAGAAAMMALTMAFVGEIGTKEQTGRYMGLLGTMSAVGTALGPALGGLLIAATGWRSVFLVNLPIGIAAALLVHRYVPGDGPRKKTDHTDFDWFGTFLLAGVLAAYALAMTIGRGHFGKWSIALLAVTAVGGGLFILTESKAAAPLIRLSLIKEPAFRSSLLMSALVSTVMMATLVVGPFYLSLAIRLESGAVGLVLSAGPVVAAFAGFPAGRLSDQIGAHRVTVLGLAGVLLGSAVLVAMPSSLGVFGYLPPVVAMTASYALFQAANNSAAMRDVPSDSRGVVSGMLNLSRNLGLITGTSFMGAVFAFAATTDDITKASPLAVTTGMRATFSTAAVLIGAALLIALTDGKSVRSRTPRNERNACTDAGGAQVRRTGSSSDKNGAPSLRD